MEVLSNPLRSRIVLDLRTGGPCTIRELSLRIVVNPKILYYPMKKLLETGLVKRIGSSKSHFKAEAVFGLTANRMELPKLANLAVRQRLMRTTLTCVLQEAMNAQAASIANTEIIDAIEIVRVPLWLCADDRKTLFKSINDLVVKYSALSSRGENDLLMWTSLIVPVQKFP